MLYGACNVGDCEALGGQTMRVLRLQVRCGKKHLLRLRVLKTRRQEACLQSEKPHLLLNERLWRARQVQGRGNYKSTFAISEIRRMHFNRVFANRVLHRLFRNFSSPQSYHDTRARSQRSQSFCDAVFGSISGASDEHQRNPRWGAGSILQCIP